MLNFAFSRPARRDLLIALVACAGLIVIFISIDFLEALFEFTREHEDWELDEFLATVPAAALVACWFAFRRWRESNGLNRRLSEALSELEALTQREREIQGELRQSHKMAALGQLAGGIAHEINNTLQPIFTLAELCSEQEDLTDKNRERMKQILSAAGRGREISQKTLMFAGSDENRSDENGGEPLDLSAALPEMMDFVTDATLSSVKLKSEVLVDTAPARISRTELTQVLTNLINNATDATEQKGTVTVSLNRATPAAVGAAGLGAGCSGMWSVTVSDDGVGMSDTVRERALDPFFSTKPPGVGTGLGLSVVRGIVEKNWGGKITVESEPGVGTTVRILIPDAPVTEGAQS